MFSRQARAHRLHRSLRHRARRFGVQPRRARGARFPANRRPAGRPRLHSPGCAAGQPARRGLRRRVGQRDVRGTCHPEQEVRERDPRFPRLPNETQPAFAPAARRVAQRLRAIPRDAARAHRAARHPRRAFPWPRDERGADGSLRRRRSVPLRERARGVLRPDRRGVLQAGPGARLRRYGRARHDGWWRRAVRHAGSSRHCAIDGRRPRRRPPAGRRHRFSGRVAGATAREGFRRDAAAQRRHTPCGRIPRRSGGRLGLLGPVRPVRAPGGAQTVPAGVVSGVTGRAGGSVLGARRLARLRARGVS